MDRLSKQARHPRESGDPSVTVQWIPAFAGMTWLNRCLFVKTQKCGGEEISQSQHSLVIDN